jgi:hypothetical protein
MTAGMGTDHSFFIFVSQSYREGHGMRTVSYKLIALMAMVLLFTAMAPSPVGALDPAYKPEWAISDYWEYEGSILIIETNLTIRVTAEGYITVGTETYEVFILDVESSMKMGALSTSSTGKDYYDRWDYTLIKSERVTKDGNSIKSTVTTYDPPRKLLEFPIELGYTWSETVTIHQVETKDSVVNETTKTVSTSFEVVGIEFVKNDDWEIECFKVKATDNETGGFLYYWYSDEIGNFVKLDVFPSVQNSAANIVDYSYDPSRTDPPVNDDESLWEAYGIYIIVLVVVIIVVVAAAAAVMVSRRRKVSKAAVGGASPAQGPSTDAAAPTPPKEAAASSTVSGQTTTQAAALGPAAGQAQTSTPPPSPDITIEDVFLVSADGRLIHHDARRLKPEVDQQVLGGMFTAIQDFIGSSFRATDGSRGAVKEIRYADSRILLEQGKFLYLAVVTEMGDTSRLQERMSRLVRLIEARCSSELQDWDGNVESVTEAKRLTRLILGNEPIPEQ